MDDFFSEKQKEKGFLMRKFFVVLVLVFGFVNVWAEVSVPHDYRLIESRNYGAYQLHKKINDNLYVAIVDLEKVDVTFGLVDRENSGNSFNKHYMYTWWNDYATNNTYAMFNGQFFNLRNNPTSLSFPLRSNYKNIITYKDPGDLKTLKIYNNGKKAQIIPGYYSYYMDDAKELIVGLDPYENKDYNEKKGRFYIAGMHYNNSTLRYLLFFIAESKTQAQMETEIDYWGIDFDLNVVMMDGSGSAQMKTHTRSLYGDGIPAYRSLPNIITIKKKWW